MADPIDFTTLKQHAPHAQYQIVDVTFGAAYTDTEVQHTLQPPTPEHVDYMVIRQAQPATIYHDMVGTRKPWRNGVISLRCDVANARATLLLTVSHDKRELLSTTPATVVPPVATHVHDAADVTTGVFDVARIPDLAASKIISGTFDVARIPDLDAAKIISGTLDVARIPDHSAAKLTSGSLDDARLSSNVPLKNGANTFSALNTFSVKPELTLGLTERGRAFALGEWTTYTPGFGGLTEGDATITGRYTKIGKTVFFRVLFLMGSTSSVSGSIIVGTPSAFPAVTVTSHFASVMYYDASTGAVYSGIANQNTTSSISLYYAGGGALAVANGTVPFTWATSDQFFLHGWYEEA